MVYSSRWPHTVESRLSNTGLLEEGEGGNKYVWESQKGAEVPLECIGWDPLGGYPLE